MNINSPYSCCDEPVLNDTKSYSTLEKLCYLIKKVEELEVEIADAIENIDEKEDSINITINRKLSEIGDFTGTWFGETKTSVDLRIENGQNLYQEVIDLIESNPELNIEIIDGEFYLSTDPIEIIDGGSYTDPVTEEIDAGLYIYPCQCKII